MQVGSAFLRLRPRLLPGSHLQGEIAAPMYEDPLAGLGEGRFVAHGLE